MNKALFGFDTPKHQMFYDESNNFRKLLLNRETAQLNTDSENFTNNLFYLGGIAFADGYQKEGDLKDAYEKFKNQVNKNKTELKFDDVAQNDFLSVLKSPHLKNYLKMLCDHDVSIHYSIVDMIYLTVTDLIDEMPVIDSFYSLYPQYRPELQRGQVGFQFKDIMYGIFNENRADFLRFMSQTNFPNIADSTEFIKQFLTFAHSLKTPENKSKIDMIIQVFSDFSSPETVYVDGYPASTDSVPLITSFGGVYYQRILTLKNCSHTFDIESEIQAAVLKLNEGSTTAVQFIDSKQDYKVQMSDIFIGFLRKFHDYHLATPLDEIKANFGKMNIFQKECIKSFITLDDVSETRCIYFLHRALAISDTTKLFEVINFYKTELGMI